MNRRQTRWALLLLLGVVAGVPMACDDGPTDPAAEGVAEEQLQFLRFPSDLLPLVTRDTSFWAVRGRDTEIVLRYAPAAGETEGEEFLTFRVRSGSLLRRPDGSRFAAGDSIEIRVAVDTTGRFLFDFEPSGLQFDPDEPAQFEVEYERLGGDLDGDGDTDAEDDEIERRLQLWKREAPGELWYPVGTVRLEELDELRAEITGFTGFAVAI